LLAIVKSLDPHCDVGRVREIVVKRLEEEIGGHPEWWDRLDDLTEEDVKMSREAALSRVDAHFEIAMVVVSQLIGCDEGVQVFLKTTLKEYRRVIESTPRGGLRFSSAHSLFLHADSSAVRAFVNACLTKNWSFWILCQRVLYLIAPSVGVMTGSDYAGRTTACALAVVIGVIPVVALKPYKYELVTIAEAFANTSLLLLGLLFLHGAAVQNPQDGAFASTSEELQSAIYVMPAVLLIICVAFDIFRVCKRWSQRLRRIRKHPHGMEIPMKGLLLHYSTQDLAQRSELQGK
jgi:hypothetical protein